VLAANSVGATQITNGSVTAAKLGTNEQKQICKAWVNFDGTNAFSPNPSTSAIRSSYNVSSVTKNGTGDYTVNFTTPMTDAIYSVIVGVEGVINAQYGHEGVIPAGQTINSSRINTMGAIGQATNRTNINVQIFGN